jgi:hypothetical protein
MVTSWRTSKQQVCRREREEVVLLLHGDGSMSTFKASVVLLALLSGCATPRPSLRQGQTRQRLTDTPAEKLAAMPVPDPAASPENQDRRFGIESARERNETARRKREEQRRCLDAISRSEAAKGKPPCLPPTTK